MRNVTVEVLSPTSARLHWFPESRDTWNGIITHYTIQYSRLRQVLSNEQATDLFMAHVTTIPSDQLRNNPNPTLAASPLMWEEVEVDGLNAYFIYSFSVYSENSAGRSASSDIVEISLPYSGLKSCNCTIS